MPYQDFHNFHKYSYIQSNILDQEKSCIVFSTILETNVYSIFDQEFYDFWEVIFNVVPTQVMKSITIVIINEIDIDSMMNQQLNNFEELAIFVCCLILWKDKKGCGVSDINSFANQLFNFQKV